MIYREFAPAPNLRGIIVRYWTMDTGVAPPAVHRVLPDGYTDLILVGGDRGGMPIIRGPRDTPLQIPVTPGQRFCGVRFWPDAAPPVMGVPAGALVDRVQPTGELMGGAPYQLMALLAAVPEEALIATLDEWWATRLDPLPALDPAVRLALFAIQAGGWGMTTEELARLVCLSPRQLQRRFRAATGMTLKTFARIRRVRGAVGYLLEDQDTRWGRIAAALGFADQSHLISEFTRLAGARPTDVARYVAGIQHEDVIA